MALSIFNQIQSGLQLDTKSVQFAEKMLSEKYLFYENMLQELSNKNLLMDQLLAENASINHHLKNLEQSLAGQINFEKQKVIVLYQKKMESLFQRAKELIANLDNLPSTIKKGPQQELSNLQRSLIEEKSQLQETDPIQEHQVNFSSESLLAQDIKVGQIYFALSLGKTVEIQAVDTRKNIATVLYQSKRVKIGTENLRQLSNSSAKVRKKNHFIFNRIELPDYRLEIDCRGTKAEDFIAIISPYLAQLENEEIPYFSIIHGHGDGILKRTLRNLLATKHHLRWENDQGNDGVTRIYLRTN